VGEIYNFSSYSSLSFQQEEGAAAVLAV
jgi:hypothetical protein